MAAYDFVSTRLFVDAPLAPNARIPVGDERANYLLNVLRLTDGANVLLFNGRDGEWRAALTQTKRRSAVLAVGERTREQTIGPDIEYCFAPLKHARLDYLVQKAVEMGASRLRPVITRRTQAARVNLERMRANVIEAAQQCGILAVPEVEAAATLDGFLHARSPERLLVVCDEDAAVADPLAALKEAPPAPAYALLVGPEGGFDPHERATLLAQPALLRISLGPRILRADTAAVAALALLQAVCGDWSGADTMSPR